MNKSKLINQIKKYYYSHGQTLILKTMEVFENNNEDCLFDVYLADSDIFLFTIQNYQALQDLYFIGPFYFKEKKYITINKWDGVKAIFTPLYIDQIFTLPTFKAITKENIVQATDYFIHKILGINLFNIKFKEEEKPNAL
jgi:hypothetical protein